MAVLLSIGFGDFLVKVAVNPLDATPNENKQLYVCRHADHKQGRPWSKSVKGSYTRKKKKKKRKKKNTEDARE